jgi:hypothetical protein
MNHQSANSVSSAKNSKRDSIIGKSNTKLLEKDNHRSTMNAMEDNPFAVV